MNGKPNRYIVSFSGDENALDLDGVTVALHWEYIRYYWIVYFMMDKKVNFTLYEFYINDKKKNCYPDLAQRPQFVINLILTYLIGNAVIIYIWNMLQIY